MAALHESLEALAHAFIAFGQTLLSHAHAGNAVESPDHEPHVPPTQKKKRVKKEQVEKKPRAQSAYNIYVKENMDKIRGDGDFENQREVMTAIGLAWRGLDEAEKLSYQQRAEKAKSATAASEAVPQGLRSPASAAAREAEAIPPSSQKRKKHPEPDNIDDGPVLQQGGESAKKKKKSQAVEADSTVCETPQDGEKKKKKKKRNKAAGLDDTVCD